MMNIAILTVINSILLIEICWLLMNWELNYYMSDWVKTGYPVENTA